MRVMRRGRRGSRDPAVREFRRSKGRGRSGCGVRFCLDPARGGHCNAEDGRRELESGPENV
jgi:hypothetical protein